MPDFNVTPGFLSSSAAEGLKAAAAQAAQAEDQANRQNPPAAKELTPVSLTAYDSATGYYSWTEQAYDGDARYTRVAGRTGTTTANPAVALDGKVIQGFPTEAFIRRAGFDSTVGIVWEIVSAGAAVADATDCAPGCGWVAGLTSRDCLQGTILSATGRCETDTDTTWAPLFSHSAGDKWVAADPLAISAVEYTVTFLRDQDPNGGDPQLYLEPVVGSGGTRYWATLDCCGEDYAAFAIGNVCSGPSDCPRTSPSLNVTRIKVEYVACPNPDYYGPGWYCVSTDGCVTSTPMYLDEDPGICEEGDDGYFQICAGPFGSEASATEVCDLPETPDPVDPPPCIDPALDFGNAVATVSNQTGTGTYFSGEGARTNASVAASQIWTWNDGVPFGGGWTHTFGVTLACSGGVYVETVSLSFEGFSVGGSPTATLVYYSASPFVMVLDVEWTSTTGYATGGTLRVTITDS